MTDDDDTAGECPRCGRTLSELVLDGARAVSCEHCGYADVPADHSPKKRVEDESWQVALDQFRTSDA